jgi:hypothetical protein
MQQAIHIFKKDTRFLRFEICPVILLAGGFRLLWPVAAAYLIARLIHAEAIPGDNQFWITRPYRWTSLITAKLLFIGAFINLPIFLVQLYQLIGHGFALNETWTGLLWSQVLMVLCLSLPAAALAAITPGMIAFMFLELILIFIVFGLDSVHFWIFLYRSPWPVGVEWIWNSIVISVAAAAAIFILILQYHWRKTFVSRIAAVSATAIGVSLYLFLPPKFALSAETHVTQPLIDTRSLGLTRAPEPMRVRMIGQGRSSQVQFAVPIILNGVPPDVDIRADGMAGTFRSSDGKTSGVFTNGADTRVDSSGKVTFQTVVFVDRTFFQDQRDKPVTLHASVYFSLFGNARSQTIPQLPEPRTVLDQFRCSTGEFEHLVQFGCSSAFRWPGEMVYAQTRGKDRASFFELISYSPFPAELSLAPFEFHTALGTQGLAPPSPLGPPAAPIVTILAKPAVAHVRRDLEVPNIRFSDLTEVGLHPPPPPKQH